MTLGHSLAELLKDLDFWAVVATFTAVIVALCASIHAIRAEAKLNRARASMLNRKARTAVDSLIDTVWGKRSENPHVDLASSGPRRYRRVGKYDELVEQFHNEIKETLKESYYLESREQELLNHVNRVLTNLRVYTNEEGDYPENATSGLIDTLEKAKSALDKHDIRRSTWRRRIRVKLDAFRMSRDPRTRG